jgi:hypothetical protein
MQFHKMQTYMIQSSHFFTLLKINETNQIFRTISSLPEVFVVDPITTKRSHQSETDLEELQQRYAQLRTSLIDLNKQRKEKLQRVDQVRALLDLLSPLKDPEENVQGNLVRRDGELVEELDKMRVLVARAIGVIGRQ